MTQRQKNRKRTAELDTIVVKGAREHNLKHVDIELPKKRLIVFTGVSGSGKSSLAFDTIFAEGQRRYVESLSAYARQFIGQMDKPRYDMIRGLSPTISIDQKAASRNPRSTVGTITEISDYLRVLYARIGEQFCLDCGKPVGRGNAQDMVDQILGLPVQTKIMLLAPIVENRKGEHRDRLKKLQSEGFARVRINGVIQSLGDVQKLPKQKKHTIEIVVDRLILKPGIAFKQRLTDSVEQCLKFGQGRLLVHVPGREDIALSEARTCCGRAYPALAPALFSFNSPQGMCPDCNGIGSRVTMDPDKIIPDKSLSIREGAVVPWTGYVKRGGARSWGGRQLAAMQEQWGFDFDRPWSKVPKRQRDIILHGGGNRELKVKWDSEKIQASVSLTWEGIVPTLMRRYRQTQSEHQKKYYAGFLAEQTCATCGGARLKPEVVGVRVGGKSIVEVSEMTIGEAHGFLIGLTLTGNRRLIGKELIKEIGNRLRFLINVGLDYLSLSRKGPTLSGGESQRIRLASQVGSELTGVLYILDEPSIGLHQRDNIRLLETLSHLRDIGNTLIVIEHDRETMETADWIVDIGPGAGLLGGQIVAQGTPAAIRRNPRSVTGRYLAGKEDIPCPAERRRPRRDEPSWLTIHGARQNNLANITVPIPLELLVAVTGVSGAGKSTLINQILYPALARHLHGSDLEMEMHFLADVYVPCETCKGRRFNDATLEVLYKDHSIAQVLDLSVRQARDLFANHPKIADILDTLIDVGLGYIKLGQSAITLSGGEAQRIKLARELAKRDTGRTLYILDEPTTGLHFQDIRMLLDVLNRLVETGNTVIVIEHNLDVIKTADWIIDLGPEGGHAGGRVVAQGSPEKVANKKSSYTGRFLRDILDG